MTSNDMQFFSSDEDNKKSLFKNFFIANQIEILSLSIIAVTTLFVITFSPTNKVVLRQEAASNIVKKETSQPANPNSIVAKNTINWLINKKDSRGIYYLVCNSAGCEVPVLAGNSGHAGLPIIWGKYKYYEVTKDQVVLNSIVNDLGNYTDTNKITTIQNQNWNCKLMYKIAKSAAASPEIKRKVENLCMTSVYFPLDITSFSAAKDLADYNSGKTTSLPKLNSLDEKGIREYPYYSSDFVAKFQWKGDPSYLETAKSYFVASLRGYNASKDKLTPEDICALGESSVDLYKVTNDDNYLIFAKNLFNKEFNFLSPVCGFFADSLFKITNDLNFFVKKNLVLINLVQNNQTVTFDLRKVGLLIGLLSE